MALKTAAVEYLGQDPGIAHRTAPEVSVVLATLNERENLPRVIDEVFKLRLPPCEILVVDDGSTDGTREYVSAIARSDSRVIPILRDSSQTLSPAQRQGILRARGEYVVVMDADLQHPPGAIVDLVKELKTGAPLVIANRYIASGEGIPRSAYRAVISRGAEWLSRIMLASARRVSDPLSGFFAFRRELFQLEGSFGRGYKLLLWLLALHPNERTAQIGYRFQRRTSGESKITHNLGFVMIFVGELLRAKKLEMHMERLQRDIHRRTRLPTLARNAEGIQIDSALPASSPEQTAQAARGVFQDRSVSFAVGSSKRTAPAILGDSLAEDASGSSLGH